MTTAELTASWRTMQAHLRRRHVVVYESARTTEVLVATLGQTRRVRIEPVEDDLVSVSAPVTRAGEMDPLAALRAHARLRIGRLAFTAELCIVQAFLAVGSAHLPALDVVIPALAAEALQVGGAG